MYRLGRMGRLNSKSRKVLICSPKTIAAKKRMIRTMCEVPPKFDPDWMGEALHKLHKPGYIQEQWLSQSRKSPVKQPVRVLHFYGSYAGEGNKIRGWDKLNGMVVPTE